MSIHHSILIPAVVIIITFSSCEKILFEPPLESNYTTTLDYAWQYTKDHYCGLHFSNVDWDSIYQTYIQQVDNNMDEAAFANLLKDMFGTFKDTGIRIGNSSSSVLHYDEYAQYPDIDYMAVEQYKPDFRTFHEVYNNTAYFNRFYEVDSSIPAISFYIEELYEDAAIKGFILDMRSENDDNGSIVDFLARQFTDTSIPAGQKKIKTGSGTDDFTDEDLYIEGQCETNCEKPIVVLTNRRTYGKGHEMVYLLSKLPNVTLVGDTTGGGNSEERITILPNGWTLQVPVECIVDTNGNSIVTSIDPDIFVNDDPMTTDKDEMIEKALELLN